MPKRSNASRSNQSAAFHTPTTESIIGGSPGGHQARRRRRRFILIDSRWYTTANRFGSPLASADDMRFTPASITVDEGETVRIVVKNDGRLMHEFVLGTKEAHDEHAALMLKFPSMEHDEPYMAHVAPGKTGEIVWTFNRAGDFDFACLLPGHFDAGMAGRIRVADR